MSFIDNYLIVGIVVSIFVQELFRFLLYKLIRQVKLVNHRLFFKLLTVLLLFDYRNAEKGLQKVSEIGTHRGSVITTNRTVLAYGNLILF